MRKNGIMDPSPRDSDLVNTSETVLLRRAKDGFLETRKLEEQE